MRITDLSPNWRGTRGYQTPASGGQRSLVRDLAERTVGHQPSVHGPTVGQRSQLCLQAQSVRFTAQSLVSVLRFEPQFQPRCSPNNTDQ